MNKNKKRGSALSQYGIIIVLVALALVPVFFMTGSYLSKYFNDFYTSLKGNATSNSNASVNTNPSTGNSVSDQDIKNGSILAGQLGGTADKPVYKCADTVCTIDYGDFVLNGIPSDFNGFVQSSGTSGGTDTLIALIDQVISAAKNLKPPIDDIHTQDLSNQGHTLAENQKKIETTIKEMNELYSINKNDGSDKLNIIIQENQAAAQSAGKFKTLHDALIQKYPNPSLEQKNLINTVDYLSKQIETLQKEMYTKVDDAISVYNAQLTDTNKTTSKFNIGENDVLNPMLPNDTHLKSGVICATGHGNDTGIKCN